MSSSYFNFSALTKFALARAEQVNAIFSGIDVGFSKLPDPDALNQQRHNYVVAGGSANVITVSLPKAPAAYVEGLRLSVKITATTTTDATINVNGLGAKAIVRANGDPTAANDLVTGQIVDMQYDGSVFRLIAASEVLAAASAAAAAASATAADTSADAAAASATAADNSADAAAASAAAAGAADKVEKSGDTMTGPLIVAPSASDEGVRIVGFSDQPFVPFYAADGTTRLGFIQVTNGAMSLVSETGDVQIITSGSTRFSIDSSGDATFTGSANGPSFFAGDVQNGIYLSGSIAVQQHDLADSTTFDRSTNSWAWNIANSAKMTLGPTGNLAVQGTFSALGAISGPTAAPGTNSTQVATTAFVQAAIAALVASSPAALDTLNELATALGSDPNFATTMTNALAAKAPLASPVLTGNPTAPTPTTGDNDTSIATTAFVQATLAASPALGGTPTAATAAAGTATTQLATTAFVDGLRDLPQNTQAGAYTLALTDRAKHVYYSGAGGHTYTIPANATVAFPVGTTIVIVNDGTGNLTIGRAASVVARWAQTGADANRTLAPGGMATLLKVATDRWIVSGAGLT